MNKFMYSKLLCAFIGILFLCTCSDDPYYGNYGDGYPSDLNRLYSNKSINPERNGALELTYSGGVMLGKEIYFEMATPKTGRLKFFDVFPGEREVLIEPFDLISANTGYTFNTQSTTSMGTTYELSGSIEDGKLKVALNNIKMPDNILSQQGNFKMIKYEGEQRDTVLELDMGFLMNWYVTLPGNEDEEMVFDALSLLLQVVASNLLFLVLPDVTFNPDGNITANYASLPDDLNVFGLLGGTNEEERGEIQSSPLNLIHYYMKNGSVYVVPNIEMIMYTIQTSQTRAEEESGVNLGEILLTILDVYPTIKDWLTEGIRFNLKENDTHEIIDYGYDVCRFGGNYQFYMDETEFYIDEKKGITLFSVLIPFITELIDLNIDLGIMSIDLTPFVERMQYTSSLKLGLYLSTEK